MAVLRVSQLRDEVDTGSTKNVVLKEFVACRRAAAYRNDQDFGTSRLQLGENATSAW
jgi:hypothetical protein